VLCVLDPSVKYWVESGKESKISWKQIRKIIGLGDFWGGCSGKGSFLVVSLPMEALNVKQEAGSSK